jgi:D-alanyl-D-alanine dipeptidase
MSPLVPTPVVPAPRRRRRAAVRLLAALLAIAGASVACRPAAAPAGTAAAANRYGYGLAVVGDLAAYQEEVRRDPDNELVDLAAAVPGVVLDVRYATRENFLGRELYPVARALLRRPAAEALAAAQRELAAEGLGLKVWDAYRPYAVTVAMWEAIRDPDYVADPAKGSRHNRGCAVDVTLVRLATAEELAMPTAHDDFTPRAAHAFAELPAETLAHRERLRSVMERHGFAPLPSEWWHYDFAGWERFSLLDLRLDDLP